MASRLNPMQLQPGMVQLAENVRLDRGVAQTRKGAMRLADSISAGEVELTLDFTLGDEVTGPIVRSVYSGGVFASGIYSSPRLDDSNEYIVLAGPDAAYLWRNGASLVTKSYPIAPVAEVILPGDDVSIIQAFDKLYLLRFRHEVEYRLASLTQGFSNLAPSSLTFSSTTITAALAAHGLTVGQRIQVSGKTGTDAVLNGSWSVATVPSTGVFTFVITTAPTASVLAISLLTYSLVGSTPTATATSNGHPLQVGNVVTVAGATPAGFNGTLTVTAVTTNTFTYTVAGTLTTPATGTITAAPSLSATVIAYGNGVATATTPAPHGYAVGEVARIFGADQAGFNAEHLITGVTSTTFTFACSSALTTPSTGVAFARRVCAPLLWDGGSGNFVRVGLGVHAAGPTFSKMPSSSIATYLNNQVAVVRGRDEVLLSDVLDAETYDPLLKSFRANVGSNDYITALHPYAESQALIFCRKSIYLATIVLAADGISIDPANSSLQLLTNEVGCSARRTLATAGIYTFFLSDSGIYRLDNQFDLKLRGNTKPLSDPIADLLLEINTPAVGTSNGIFFNNRYWLAVPTKLANGDPATSPNTLFIYNMLNESWESRDIYAFNLDQLLVTDYGTERRLYAVSRNGKLYLLDQYEDGRDDQPSGTVNHTTGAATTQVAGKLLTRRYGFGSLIAKRMSRVTSSIVLPAGAACALDAVTTDPDDDFEITTLTNSGFSLEDYTVKGPIRRKANLLDIRWRTTAGRPILRAVMADASVASLPQAGSKTEY